MLNRFHTVYTVEAHFGYEIVYPMIITKINVYVQMKPSLSIK